MQPPSRAATATPLTSPKGQTNFYGLAAYDHEDVDLDRYTLRIEHDVARDIQASNQTRYSDTRRFAEVSLPSYSTTTNLAARNHSISDRTTEVFSNQTNVTARLATGRFAHALSTGLELTPINAEVWYKLETGQQLSGTAETVRS